MIQINQKCWNESDFWLNQFCHDNSDLDDKFGSKKLIKSWFDKILSRNITPGQFNCLSLLYST